MNRDVIAIGASAGGVDVLLGMASELPPTLPASVFVVLHTAPEYANLLPELLNQRGRLKATLPVHNEEIRPGRIYVAPPDNHMELRPGFIQVVRGPKENGHRPAVDALFRTASWAYGSRVIGVVLSGYQDCGTAGMMSIKARGGIGVVQDPESAAVPDMPQHVLESGAVDHVVHSLELPGLLVRLVNEAAPGATDPPDAVRQLEGTAPGKVADLVCPACQGVLSEVEVGAFQHFRCHVGHAFSLASLARHQSTEMERALWAAVRSLEEGATLSRRLSTTEHTAPLRRRFAEKAETQERQAELIRRLLLEGDATSMPAVNEE